MQLVAPESLLLWISLLLLRFYSLNYSFIYCDFTARQLHGHFTPIGAFLKVEKQFS